MQITPLAVADAWRIDPQQHRDGRGWLAELWRVGPLTTATGRDFPLGQTILSSSSRNVLRGIHAVPGQAKVVTCVRGVVLDVVVDIRVGSPTFGVVDALVLDAAAGTSVQLAGGLGHAFLARTDDVLVHYTCSSEYAGTMIDIQALDPELAIPWELAAPPVRSAKDAAAPVLATALAAGILPDYRPPPAP